MLPPNDAAGTRSAETRVFELLDEIEVAVSEIDRQLGAEGDSRTGEAARLVRESEQAVARRVGRDPAGVAAYLRERHDRLSAILADLARAAPLSSP